MKPAACAILLLFPAFSYVLADEESETCEETHCPPGTIYDETSLKCVDNYSNCTLKCPEGQHCELTSVECKKPPCLPVQQCVPGAHGPCSISLCSGVRCVDLDGQAKCLPPRNCKERNCPRGTTCDDITLECVRNFPFCELKCSKNEHCELQTVNCIRSPCPPIQVCVPGQFGPCAMVRCPGGRCVDLDMKPKCLPPGE